MAACKQGFENEHPTLRILPIAAVLGWIKVVFSAAFPAVASNTYLAEAVRYP